VLSEPDAWPSCEEADSAGPTSNPVKMIAILTLITGKVPYDWFRGVARGVSLL